MRMQRRAGLLVRATYLPQERSGELVGVLERRLAARTRCRTISSTAHTDALSGSTGASARAPAAPRRRASPARPPRRRNAQRTPPPAQCVAIGPRADTTRRPADTTPG